jgi:hypothetical protein
VNNKIQTLEDLKNEIENQRCADWRAIMKLKSGRRVLGELFNLCNTMVKNNADEIIEFARQEGRRQIGTHIVKRMLDYCANDFLQMHYELKSAIRERAIFEKKLAAKNKQGDE